MFSQLFNSYILAILNVQCVVYRVWCVACGVQHNNSVTSLQAIELLSVRLLASH